MNQVSRKAVSMADAIATTAVPPSESSAEASRSFAEVSKIAPLKSLAKFTASPRARLLAAELSIDITAVIPQRGQRIVEADIRRFYESRESQSRQVPTPERFVCNSESYCSTHD